MTTTRSATVFLVAALASASADAALVALWSADGTGAESVGGRSASAVKGAGYRAGRFGQAFHLDGTNQSYSVPDDPLWTFPGDFTIALWVEFDTLPPGPGSALPNTLVGHDTGGGTANKWVFSYDADSNKPVFHLNGGGSAFLVPDGSFDAPTSTWVHLALTRTGTTSRFYAGGAEIGSAVSAAPLLDAAVPLTFGEA